MNDKKDKPVKFSRFMKWVIGLAGSAVMLLIIYMVLEYTSSIAKWGNLLQTEDKGKYNWASFFTLFGILSIVILYILSSLYFLFTRVSWEDGRMHCMPLIISPIFLICENGLLHLYDGVHSFEILGKDVAMPCNYYNVTMTVFTTIAVAVITFASLKYSFILNLQNKRFAETSNAKPNIRIIKQKRGYKISVENKKCYLCGTFFGSISKITYRDIKKMGNSFCMHDLYYPNTRTVINEMKEGAVKLKFDAKLQDLISQNSKKQDIYIIFRDTQNYFYFIQLPTDENYDLYNAIGVNEITMTRLVYLFNRRNRRNKRKKNKAKIIYRTYPCAQINRFSTNLWIGFTYRIIWNAKRKTNNPWTHGAA